MMWRKWIPRWLTWHVYNAAVRDYTRRDEEAQRSLEDLRTSLQRLREYEGLRRDGHDHRTHTQTSHSGHQS